MSAALLLLVGGLTASPVVAHDDEDAIAENRPPVRLVLGGGLGTLGSGVETTLVVFPMGPFLSAGARSNGDGRYVYGEIAGWFLATAGIGGGYLAGTGGHASTGVLHVFLGVPLGILGYDGHFEPVGCGEEGCSPLMMYIEPYYRPELLLASADVRHELGVMLRIAFALNRHAWRARR